MPITNLDALLRPRSIALIGPNRIGEAELACLLDRIADSGYLAPVTLVGFADPHGAFSDVDTLAELTRMPDLAVLTCGPEDAVATLTRLAEGGTKAAVMIASGSEIWPKPIRKALREIAQTTSMRLIGPGSLGLASPSHRLQVHLAVEPVPVGDLALVSRSGVIMNATLGWAAAHGVGFSHIVSLGDRVDVDIADLLDWFTGDPQTRAILVHLEAVANARKFLSAARAAARTKPVVVIRAGASADERGPGLSDAGRLATTDAVYDAALRRAGVLRVDGLDDLFDAAETITRVHPNLGRRLAILANGRSLATIAADKVQALGGELAQITAVTVETLQPLLRAGVEARNPVVLGSNSPPETYTAAITALLADRGVDGVIVSSAPTAFASPAATASGIIAAAGRGASEPRARKAVIAALATADRAPNRLLEASGIPCYRTSAEAVRAFMYIARYSEAKKLLMTNPPSLPGDFTPRTAAARAVVSEALGDSQQWLDRRQCCEILAAYDIDCAPEEGGAAVPVGRPHGELFAGLADDPVFGPIIVFGQGGASLEHSDHALDLVPLDLNLAEALIGRTRIARAFGDDAPGAVPAARHAIALLLVKLAQLAVDIPEIREVDLNPCHVDADGSGVVVSDMRISVAPPEIVPGRLGTSRLAIRPYPQEWERTLALKSGRRVFIRPVRPEDEDAFKAFFETISPDDLRLRFFAPVRDFSHAFLVRLTQLDYSRAMAFAAFDAESREMLGAVRLHADPDHETGEYAILVQSGLKGVGLGWMLMNLIIEYAGRDGIRTITGEVLKENTTMLKMCRSLGFSVTTSEHDDMLAVVTLPVPVPEGDGPA